MTAAPATQDSFTRTAAGFIVFGNTHAAVTHPAITALPYERSIQPWVRAYFPDAEYVARGDDVRAIDDDDLPLHTFRGVLALQGAKGLGKSKAVHAAVARLAPATTAVQITFRRCLAWSSNRLMGEGAALYTDVPASTTLSARAFPRLTILINSISRVRGCYDVVVIDELVSVVDMLAGRRLMGAESRIAALFTLAQLIAGARVVLVADAVLDAACLQFVCLCRRINDPAAHVPLRVLDYTYRLHRDYAYVAHENEATWRAALDTALAAGKHVVVPCMTKGMANRLAAAYGAKYTVRCYTADVDPAQLHEHMRDIHTHWAGVQLLIYSPVITAGCSFELAHYDVVFFYGMAGLGSVRSAMQMIARVRSIASKTVHVYVSRAQRYTPLTNGELERYLGTTDGGVGMNCIPPPPPARSSREARPQPQRQRQQQCPAHCASAASGESAGASTGACADVGAATGADTHTNTDSDTTADTDTTTDADVDVSTESDASSPDAADGDGRGVLSARNAVLAPVLTTADVQMRLLRHLDRYNQQEEALAALAFPFYFWSLVVHSGASVTFPAQHLVDRIPPSLLASSAQMTVIGNGNALHESQRTGTGAQASNGPVSTCSATRNPSLCRWLAQSISGVPGAGAPGGKATTRLAA